MWPRASGPVTARLVVSAARCVEAPAEAVYAFLAHLPNHERFTHRRLRLLSLSADRSGGRIAVRGPLGIRRTAETRVTELRPHALIGGTARVGRRTSATVRWTIHSAGDGTAQVALTATVLTLSPLDRLLLAIGGRRWLAHGFARTIAHLATALTALPAPDPTEA